MKEAKTPLYYREETKTWMMILYDPETGRRLRRSTKTQDYEKALQVYHRAIKDLECGMEALTLRGVISLYTSPETNPRYKIAQIEGTLYGLQHAKQVAGRAKKLLALLELRAPAYLKKDVRDIVKLDIKNIRQIIIECWGQRRKSQQAFSDFKTMLSQCAQDGYIEASPSKDVRDIPYKSITKPSFTAEQINKVLALKDLCPNREKWAFFALIATTGMRMSEALALSEKQIYKGTLTIDSALKSNDSDDIGLPKYELIRVIPLSEISIGILADIKPDKDGRYFHHNRSWGVGAMREICMMACGAYPEEREIYSMMSSHTLRHSMNTNLLTAGLPPLLVAEYLSWNHQCVLDMQQRYTHVYAEAMRPIADKIDELYRIPASEGMRRHQA